MSINKPEIWKFKTLLYADITTHVVNWQNFISYKVLFNSAFENEDEVLEILNYLENAWIDYMISCNWKDITHSNLSSAVWEMCFTMDEYTFLFLQHYLQKAHKWSYISAKVENTRWYVTWEVALLLPNNAND